MVTASSQCRQDSDSTLNLLRIQFASFTRHRAYLMHVLAASPMQAARCCDMSYGEYFQIINEHGFILRDYIRGGTELQEGPLCLRLRDPW